jgi:methylated-DNA-protein-cysteine methyltransferase-like protein
VYERIYAVVRRIPRGRVATYGQVAVLADASGPRQIGYALHALEVEDVPWHRVINAKGECSLGPESKQRARLEAEGVVFSERGRVDLKTFRWVP